MKLKQYIQMDAIDLALSIRNKEISPKEVCQLSIEQLLKVNKSLNAVSSVRDEAMLKAEWNDLEKRMKPFYGVPLFLKDISQSIKGERLTGGAKLLQHYVSHVTSHFSNRLIKAGFIYLGHSTVPEFALKNITEPELYGVTRNPWDGNYSPGGSSGGAAALVASGVVPVAGASDGGGSIRIPASFTSLVGLKPTRGRTPVGPGIGRQWHGAAIDFVLSRTVRDSAALLDILQVIQPEAAFQIPLYEEGYVQTLQKEFNRPLTIGFSTESPVQTPVSNEAKEAVTNVITWLEREGHQIEEVKLDYDGVQLMRDYYLMNSGEMAALLYQLEKEIGRKITEEDVEIETWLLSEAGKAVSARAFTMSLASWDVVAEKMANFHKTFDLFVTPTTAFSAPKIGELTHCEKERQTLLNEMKDKNKQELQQLIYNMFLPSLTYSPFTQLANLTGQPAISVPTHLTKKGLPLGVQLMAAKGNDHLLLQIAYQLEQSHLWVGMNGNPYFSN